MGASLSAGVTAGGLVGAVRVLDGDERGALMREACRMSLPYGDVCCGRGGVGVEPRYPERPRVCDPLMRQGASAATLESAGTTMAAYRGRSQDLGSSIQRSQSISVLWWRSPSARGLFAHIPLSASLSSAKDRLTVASANINLRLQTYQGKSMKALFMGVLGRFFEADRARYIPQAGSHVQKRT